MSLGSLPILISHDVGWLVAYPKNRVLPEPQMWDKREVEHPRFFP